MHEAICWATEDQVMVVIYFTGDYWVGYMYIDRGDLVWGSVTILLTFVPNFVFVIWCLHASRDKDGKMVWFRRDTWYRVLTAFMLPFVSVLR